MNLAVLEERERIAEDEVDIAFDVAIGEVLARGLARPLFGVAALAVGVEGVLVAEEAHVAEDGAVALDANATAWEPSWVSGRFRLKVFSMVRLAAKKSSPVTNDAGRLTGAARGPGALVEAEDDVFGSAPRPRSSICGLSTGDLFFVGARLDANDASGGRRGVPRRTVRKSPEPSDATVTGAAARPRAGREAKRER